MTKELSLKLDRGAKASLTEQIFTDISRAIRNGTLQPGSRLPSWQDLATQLGVARGTVRIAYEKLAASQLVVASRAHGTRVTGVPSPKSLKEQRPPSGSFLQTYLEMTEGPAFFQPGIPAQSAFPATLFSRIRSNAVRLEASSAPIYPDPRGEPELRKEIAAYLAVARGIECLPTQVIVTAGYAGGLGVVLRALGLEGQEAWMEDPGFPFTRHALELARVSPVPVPVDLAGLNVQAGIQRAPKAGLVVVTPGQQAPTGVTMSLERRLALIEWASSKGAWIVEDDYLSELQLVGRAAPAIASLDRRGCVIHIGSFSKTLTPTLRVGFVVAPESLAIRMGEVAACLSPPPSPSTQLAVAEFMKEGHYIRHLRRLKRLYVSNQKTLLSGLSERGIGASAAGLSVTVPLPANISDIAVAREALSFGLGPAPLSPWFAGKMTASGLILSVATIPTHNVERSFEGLNRTLARFL